MSALAIDRTAPTRRTHPDGGSGPLHGRAVSDRNDTGGVVGPTLGCLIERTWAQLGEHSAARCPVCGGTMLRAAAVRGGRCTRCRATLG